MKVIPAAIMSIYSKKLQYVALAAFIGLSSLLAVPVAKAEGIITIDTCMELQMIGRDDDYSLNAEYELGGDIDCTGSEEWDENSGFLPIGFDYENQFTGEFNGKGHKITNLKIQRLSTDYVGLFGWTANAIISDVHLVNPTIQGRGIVGGIAGRADNTALLRVSVLSVNGTTEIGAMGYDDEGTITATVGGLVGVMVGGTSITDSFARTTIVTYYEGFARFGGSLVGYTAGSGGSIRNTYTVPSINGAFTSDTAGPLVGSMYYDTELSSSFWNSTVYVGDGMETAGNSGNGRTTTWLKTQSNFVDAGWDFDNVWIINSDNNGYPHLRAPGSGGPVADSSNDKNGDGTVDSSQANVSALTSTVSGKTVVLEVDNACTVSEAVMQSVSENAKQDPDFNYPQGLMDFTAVCGTPGFTSTVTQYYYGIELGTLSLRKYNPVTQQYSAITGANISQQTIYGQNVVVATYEVTDGGPLDADGVANGTIVDPAGLASAIPGAPNTGVGAVQSFVTAALLPVFVTSVFIGFTTVVTRVIARSRR